MRLKSASEAHEMNACGFVHRVVAVVALPCAILLTPPVPADQPWHCGVGVAGGYASGYDGLLARSGIPHELLMNHQLMDLATLRKYDLVMLGSMYPSLWPQIVGPLERYVQAGGSVFMDSYYQLSSVGSVSPVEGQVPVLAQYFAANPPVKSSTCAFQLTGKDNPLTPEASTEAYAGLSVVNRIIHDLPKSRVLAQYTAINIPDEQKGNNLPALNAGDPAMVLVSRGRGYYLLCGPALSVGLTLSGVNVESLVLGAVRFLTHGRGVPQLIPEGFKLSGGQSALSLKLAGHNSTDEEQEETYPPPVREKGPGKPTPLPEGFKALTDDQEAEFAVTGTYSPTVGEATILLNYWNDRNHWSLTFGGRQVTLTQVRDGRTAWEGSATIKGPGAQCPFVMKERLNRVSVYLPGPDRLQSEGGSLWSGAVGSSGEALANLRYQPVGPVYFADDFMRTQDQQGEWEVLSGDWRTAPVQNPELGPNPFSYRVTSAGGDAFAVAGYSFWDNYRYHVAVRPESATGLMGIMAYVEDARNFWLFQARINSTPTAYADGFQLIRVTDASPDILAKAPGALVRGQWYDLGLKMVDKWIGAYVDGEKVLSLTDTTFSGGRVGLWLRNAQVRFDDVEVKSSRSADEPVRLFRGTTPAYAGVIDQDSWAGPASEWRADPDTPGLFRNRTPLFGDGGLQFAGRVLASAPNATVWLGFSAASDSPGPGDEVGVWARFIEGRLNLSLNKNNSLLRRGQVATESKTPPVISLRRSGPQFVVAVNHHDELSLKEDCLEGKAYHLAFRVQGARPKISEVSYWGRQVQNDTFQTSPVNWWVQRGEWDVTNRWSCSPGWSWFGGYSSLNPQNQYAGVAAVWSKEAFGGDLSVRFYTGPKMLQVPNTNNVLEQLADFNVTLCGDGKDVRSGYAFVVAPGGADKAQLLRQGAVVTETKQFIMPREGHNRWIELTAERAGRALRLMFDGQPLLAYEDPQPLPGGHVALWTENNGILIPLVTVSFSEQRGPLLSKQLAPPEPKTGLEVDLGKTFDFKDTLAGWWSLDDKAVVSRDTTTYQSTPASLCYQFQPRNGALPVVLSPPLHVAGAKSVSVFVRASVGDRVVFTLMEEDMSRYVTEVNVPANKWVRLELPLSRFILPADSADENGRLDPEEINAFTVTDMDAVLAMKSDKGYPERRVWVDDLRFSQ